LLLTNFLTPARVRIPLRARSKEEMLRELVQIVAQEDRIQDLEDVLRAVREREQVLSTGIGNGVAIPHGKSAAVPDLRIAAGVAAEPIDFDALDGQPVRLFFLLVGPESAAGTHIKVLSRISRLIRKESIRDQLLAARNAEEFCEVLKRAEGA